MLAGLAVFALVPESSLEKELRVIRATEEALPWHDLDAEALIPACEGGDLHACTDLGLRYERLRSLAAGRHALPAAFSRKLFLRACSGGFEPACPLHEGADGDPIAYLDALKRARIRIEALTTAPRQDARSEGPARSSTTAQRSGEAPDRTEPSVPASPLPDF